MDAGQNQAAAAQQQVTILEQQLDVVEQQLGDERAAREAEAERSQAALENATRSIRETIKARLDSSAPRVSVSVEQQLLSVTSVGGTTRQPVTVTEVLVLVREQIREWEFGVMVAFKVANHGDTTVEVFVANVPEGQFETPLSPPASARC